MGREWDGMCYVTHDVLFYVEEIMLHYYISLMIMCAGVFTPGMCDRTGAV